MTKQLRQGDVIIVWKLDCLSGSLRDLVNLNSMFQELVVGFKSLRDNIDTTTPTGKLTFRLFAALAEFEKDIISTRTKASLEAARARGRKGGCPREFHNLKKWWVIVQQQPPIQPSTPDPGHNKRGVWRNLDELFGISLLSSWQHSVVVDRYTRPNFKTIRA